jgi:hypothetical protein
MALPSVCLVFAVFHFGWEAAGMVNPLHLPARYQLGLWLLEALGLSLLFLLLQGAGRSRWAAGVAAGWIGWVFRGPAVVLTVVAAAGLPREPWWTLALGWLGLYTACGLVLALVAHRADP